MASYYAIQRLAISDQQWTAIVVPIHCATIRIENVSVGLTLAVRTDPGNPATEKRIAATGVLAIQTSTVTFEQGDAPCSVQFAFGTGVAVVEFLR